MRNLKPHLVKFIVEICLYFINKTVIETKFGFYKYPNFYEFMLGIASINGQNNL